MVTFHKKDTNLVAITLKIKTNCKRLNRKIFHKDKCIRPSKYLLQMFFPALAQTSKAVAWQRRVTNICKASGRFMDKINC